MKMTAADVAARVAAMPGWTVQSDVLVRQYVFDGFPDAITFASRLAFDAEAHDHHPDLQINYRKVTVRWSTHSDGGITEKDFAGAATSDRLARRLAPPAGTPAS